MSKRKSINRWQIGTNVILQIALVAGIIAMINYLGFNYYQRWDMSRDQKYALSQPSKDLLAQLPGKVRFIVFFSPTSIVYQDVDNLLKEYQYATRNKIEIELVDPYRNLPRARELAAQYGFGGEENIVIVDYDGRHKFVGEPDMAEIDHSGMMMGQPSRIVAFKGEQAITSAILEVSEDKQNLLYFLGGTGAPDIGPGSPMQSMLQFIERQNVRPAELKLAEVDAVPEDASAVVLAGARYDFSEREMGVLRDYWERQGRILLLLEPEASTPRLHAFLEEFGITPNDDRVLRTVEIGPLVGILREVSCLFQPGHAITKDLAGISSQFFGATQSLKLPEEPPENIRLSPLVVAAEGFWGETNYRRGTDDPVYFDPSTDQGPPVTLAVAAEKGALQDSRMQVATSRLVVVANAACMLDDALDRANVDFLLSSINWLLDREAMIGIAPKEIQAFSLNLTEEQIRQLALLCMIVVPAAVAALGVLVWWRRRS